MRLSFIAASLLCSPALAANVYYVGNSLTNDGVLIRDGVTAIAQQHQQTHTAGYHITSGVGLDTVWNQYANHAYQYDYVSPSPFDQALANNAYQAISLQGFQRNATLEAAAAVNIIGLARAKPVNKTSQVYLYAPWGDSANFHARWNETYLGQDVYGFLSRGYYDEIFSQVRQSDPGVRLIPAGEVFDALYVRIAAGQLAGVTAFDQLFRDVIHANELGQFAAATTIYATIYGTDPRGMPVPYNFGGVPAATASQIQDTVWETVLRLGNQTGVPEPTAMGLLLVSGAAALRRVRK